MNSPRGPFHRLAAGVVILGALGFGIVTADEPPALNPFGPKAAVREDAIPGYVELSDGTIYTGRIYLTRDTRLKIYDESLKRQRLVPLNRVTQIDCAVEREWMEKEWRFRENANNRKVYTGRKYPARIFVHSIRLQDGRKIRGPLSGIVYVQQAGASPRHFLLQKRQKGPMGTTLKSLVYLKTIHLGPEALKKGKKLALEQTDGWHRD